MALTVSLTTAMVSDGITLHDGQFGLGKLSSLNGGDFSDFLNNYFKIPDILRCVFWHVHYDEVEIAKWKIWMVLVWQTK